MQLLLLLAAAYWSFGKALVSAAVFKFCAAYQSLFACMLSSMSLQDQVLVASIHRGVVTNPRTSLKV
jgi:hypothetical protein